MSEENDLETVVKKIREKGKGGTDLDEVVDLINKSKVSELKTIAVDALIEEQKAKLEEARRKQKRPATNLAGDFLSHIIQEYRINPERAGQFLSSLNEDQIRKLKLIESAGEGGGITPYLPLLRNEGMNVKDVVSIFQMMHQMVQPQTPKSQGITLDGLAKIFEAGVKAAQTQKPESSPMEQFNFAKTMLEGFYTALSDRDKTIMDTTMQLIQSRMPPDPREWYKGLKEDAKLLGLGEKGTTAEIERQKLEWQRYKHDKDDEWRRFELQFRADRADKEATKELIKTLVEGPLGKTLQGLGSAAAQKISGPQMTPGSVLYQCQKCGGTFPGRIGEKTVICPHCNTSLTVGPQVPESGQPPEVSEQKTSTAPSEEPK